MGGNGDMSLNDRILQYLESVGGFDTYDFAQKINEDHTKIVGAVKSLLAYDELVTTENRSRTLWALTPEGNEFVNEGSKEMRVFKLVPSEGMPIAQVMTQGTKIGFNKAVANGWLRVEKGIVKPLNAPTEDTVQIHLENIFKNCPEKVSQVDKDTYKKRKLIEQVIVNSLYVDKGQKFTVELQKVENDLTAEMIATGAWKDLAFKPYNYNSMGTLPEGGHLHPLLKVRAQIRQIFLEMGFTEMPTNNYVESSFWNFDALFQPQQHPAREAHDTFFLSEPALSNQFPRDYLEQVKRVHSRGGFGSQGYGYEWQEEEAKKNLLRTHTTAVSARMLYKLAKEGFRPAKYFSIDRVFRNEELDATHLAEFQQVEGVIADHNLTLGNLIGVLSEFFKKMGMDQLRFKPAYNPYTEPSMEIFSYHNGLGKWIEVGNSGVFRPEMLLPMGLPEDVNVIAWGLSLERPTMIKYGIDNIRDLVGPRVDLQMVYDNPICRLDKIFCDVTSMKKIFLGDRTKIVNLLWTSEGCKPDVNICMKVVKEGYPQQVQSEPSIEDKARSMEDTWQLLSFQIVCMKNEIRRLHSLVNQSRQIICVNPSTPPYSLLVLLRLVKSFTSKTLSVETNLHSALPLLSSYFNYYLSTNSQDSSHGKGSADFNFSFVWKQTAETKLSFYSSQRDIVGEVNVCRYLARIAEENSSTLTLYERKGEVKSSQIDECVDIVHSLLTTSNREKQNNLLQRVDKLLVASPFITGSSVSVADICLWSAINQLSDIDIIPLNVRKFYVRCCNHPWFAPHLS